VNGPPPRTVSAVSGADCAVCPSARGEWSSPPQYRKPAVLSLCQTHRAKSQGLRETLAPLCFDDLAEGAVGLFKTNARRQPGRFSGVRSFSFHGFPPRSINHSEPRLRWALTRPRMRRTRICSDQTDNRYRWLNSLPYPRRTICCQQEPRPHVWEASKGDIARVAAQTTRDQAPTLQRHRICMGGLEKDGRRE
jgi:hypothetical protein